MLRSRSPAVIGATLPFGGATGTNVIALTDNLADALSVSEGATNYLKFVTTDSSEYVGFGKPVLLSQGTVTFGAVTGSNVIGLQDNFADALSISESTNAYLTFVSTDSAEAINAKKRLTVTDGVASGTARTVGGTAFVDVAAADTVLASVSNNAFVTFAQSYAIPANTLKAGSILRISALVIVNNASGTDTLTVNIRLGGTSLLATTAVDPGATTDFHMLDFEITSRAAPSATSSLVGRGRWTTNTGGTNVTGTAILAPANFATNGALTIDSQAKWSSNTANTSARLEMLNVEII